MQHISPSKRARILACIVTALVAGIAHSQPAQNGGVSGCIAPGKLGDRANITPDCYKDRQSAFGWGDSADAACGGAQREARDGFGAKTTSGCYCKANATVNSVAQPYVCWVIFD